MAVAFLCGCLGCFIKFLLIRLAKIKSDDSTHASHLFFPVPDVYIHAEKDVIGKSVYVKNFIEEDLVNFRAKAAEVAE